jgi:hypothetical protein
MEKNEKLEKIEELTDEEEAKLKYMESANLMLEVIKKYPNKYFHNGCEDVTSILNAAMLNFWRLIDLANDKDEQISTIARKIMNRSCRVKNFKEAENLYWD